MFPSTATPVSGLGTGSPATHAWSSPTTRSRRRPLPPSLSLNLRQTVFTSQSLSQRLNLNPLLLLILNPLLPPLLRPFLPSPPPHLWHHLLHLPRNHNLLSNPLLNPPLLLNKHHHNPLRHRNPRPGLAWLRLVRTSGVPLLKSREVSARFLSRVAHLPHLRLRLTLVQLTTNRRHIKQRLRSPPLNVS